MAEIVLFHHAQGLTSGVTEFAAALQRAGHTVHVPDLYEGKVFPTLDEGLAYAGQTGFGTIIERGQAAAQKLPAEIVYAGFSLGVLPAQMLAQTRSGAKGALLFHSCVPAGEFGGWPAGVPVQIHAMEADHLFTDEGTWTRPAPWSRRPPTPSCTSIPAISTCSPTAASLLTISQPPSCSPNVS